MQNSNRHSSHEFAPWKTDLSAGAAWLAAGVLIGAVGLLGMPHSLRLAAAGLGALIGLAGLARVQRGLARRYGKRLERRAALQLRKVLRPDVHMRESVLLSTGGDADVVVDSSPRWVIEIKSHRAVQVRRKVIGSDQILHPGTHAPVKGVRAFLGQARRNAETLHGQPVLWFPAAPTASSGTVDGVKVVTGSARYLARQCDLPKAGWFDGAPDVARRTL